MEKFKGAIFDLDGVLVDTARYHYMAWRQLAEKLGFTFTQEDNERLKGVSRMRSLEILLEIGGIEASQEEKERMASEKNTAYVKLLEDLDRSALLPGAEEYLHHLHAAGVRVSLGSASKNALFILKKLGIVELFDAVIDGTMITRAKPDPEIFQTAAEALGLLPRECVVFEDAQAGIEAARSAGCRAVAIGRPDRLTGADHYASCLMDLLETELEEVALCTEPATYCNPLNLSYVYQEGYHGRELADPAVVEFKGLYYLFASHGHGYWWSNDLADWQFIYVDWSKYGEFSKFAPAACAVGDYLYITHSNYGDILRSADPLSGQWEFVSHPEEWVDPAMIRDTDGRIYCYYGCSPTYPIQVVELDPDKAMAKVQGPVDCLQSCREERGFEVAGDDNTAYDRDCWLEGAWMTEYHGRYYLQYAAPGTEYRSYADGCFVGESPLGPFEYCTNSPIAYKATGFLPGAGHGSLIQDSRGNWWKFDTAAICQNHIFERRILMVPAGFDRHGQLVTNMVRADYPLYKPMKVEEHFFRPGPGWELLSLHMSPEASSFLEGHEPERAFDENIQDWWSATDGAVGQWIQGDMGEVCTVYALQINFADQDVTDVAGRDNEFRHRYLLELSLDGRNWHRAVDRQNASGRRFDAVDTTHDYFELTDPVAVRYVRLTNMGEIPAGGKVAVSGIRLFGRGHGREPAFAPTFTVYRDPGDRRIARLKWETVPEAEGYIVRFGNASDSQHLHVQIIGETDAVIHCLNAGTAYYFSVDAYNRNGYRHSEQIIESL